SEATAHYLLFRMEVDPETTFRGDCEFDPASLSPPNYLPRLTTPGAADIIADNVIDFGLWLYAREADGGLVRIYPDNAIGGYAGYPDARGRWPAVADVMVRILTPDGAQLLAAGEARGTPDEWWRIAESHSRVFTQRILLAVTPL
ncbi:MAG: hypothetical protein ACHQ4G_13050, partial [Opitutales bacterium]